MTKKQLQILIEDGDIIEATPDFTNELFPLYISDSKNYSDRIPLNLRQKFYFPSIQIVNKVSEIFDYLCHKLCSKKMLNFRIRVALLLESLGTIIQEKVLKDKIENESNSLSQLVNEDEDVLLLIARNFQKGKRLIAKVFWINTFEIWNFIWWLKFSYIGKEEIYTLGIKGEECLNFHSSKLYSSLCSLGLLNDKARKIFEVLLQIEKIEYLKRLINELHRQAGTNDTRNSTLNSKESHPQNERHTHRELMFAYLIRHKLNTEKYPHKTGADWKKELKGRASADFSTTQKKNKNYRAPQDKELQRIIKLLEDDKDAQKIAINLLENTPVNRYI